MQSYRWPGNVRELENALKGALAYAVGDQLTLLDFPILMEKASDVSQCRKCMGTRFVQLPPFAQVEAEIKRGYFEELLRRTNGSIPRAAEQAGMSAQGLRKLLKSLETKQEGKGAKGRSKPA
jgi:DNA-binding NtrC family response regulator